MRIHTPTSLRTSRHRVERRMEKAQVVLKTMQAGAALQLQYTKHGPCWVLSNGLRVKDDVAKLIVTSASVVGVGDALFDGTASQTYRWWSAE
jgi:hypothetical protein